jgi:hypothetical protein
VLASTTSSVLLFDSSAATRPRRSASLPPAQRGVGGLWRSRTVMHFSGCDTYGRIYVTRTCERRASRR